MNKLIKILAIMLGSVVVLGSIGTACYYSIPAFKTQVNDLFKKGTSSPATVEEVLTTQILDDLTPKVRVSNSNPTINLTEIYSVSTSYDDEVYNVSLDCIAVYGKTLQYTARCSVPFNDCGDLGQVIYEYLQNTDISQSTLLAKIYDLVHSHETTSVAGLRRLYDSNLAETGFNKLKNILLQTDLSEDEKNCLQRLDSSTARLLDPVRSITSSVIHFDYSLINYSGTDCYCFTISMDIDVNTTTDDLKEYIENVIQTITSTSGEAMLFDTSYPYTVTTNYSTTGTYGFN